MADSNLFTEVKDALQDFKDFLDGNVTTIKTAVDTIASLIPQINDLIDLLIDLMGKMKTEIQDIDVSSIPGLTELSEFTDKLDGFLESAKKLLPDETAAIDEIGDVADVVTSLPSLDEVKGEIISLIDAILGHLNTLKSS